MTEESSIKQIEFDFGKVARLLICDFCWIFESWVVCVIFSLHAENKCYGKMPLNSLCHMTNEKLLTEVEQELKFIIHTKILAIVRVKLYKAGFESESK